MVKDKMSLTNEDNLSVEFEKKVILEVTELRKHFEGVKAVDDVSFSIKSGELIGIIGPNGAGKTTLFNLLSGFIAPDNGKIVFNQKNITGYSAFKVAKAGMVRTFQQARPFKMLDALDNAKIPHVPKNMFSRSRTLKNKATRSLISVDLAEKKNYPAVILPGGDLKRLDFARAIALQPQILLLDEPFAGLSPEESFRVERVVKEASQIGMTIIIVEHKLRILMRLVQHVIVLDQGKLIAKGTPQEISNNPDVISAYLGTEAGKHV